MIPGADDPVARVLGGERLVVGLDGSADAVATVGGADLVRRGG